jgi:CRP-like cAMP-binding protein
MLENLAPAELNSILAAARLQHFLKNSVITNQGHPASRLFLVLTGGARSFFLTQTGQKLHIHWYLPGEVFGGMALVARPSNYLASTEATKNTYVLAWERESIRGLAAQYPRINDNALTIASNYVSIALATQVSLSSHSARQRLAHALVNLANGIGHAIGGGMEVMVGNEELASAANVTPFTASRILSEWQGKRLVRKSRGKVLVKDPERLLLEDL